MIERHDKSINNMNEKIKQPLFERIDCIHIRVSDIDSGLAFYQKSLGLKLLWRTENACGLGMKADESEIVISTEDYLAVDLKVENVEEALKIFIQAGGKVEEGPFNIDIGKCAVVSDLWGNKYCLLDTTNGTYDTNDDGVVCGVSKKVD